MVESLEEDIDSAQTYHVPTLWRVIENKHSNRDRSTTYLQGECSHIRDEYTVEAAEVQRRSSACSQ